MEKHSVSRLSYPFAHLHLLSSYSFSSTLISSNLSLLSASSLLCFSSFHIVGSLTSKLPSTITATATGATTSTTTLELQVRLQLQLPPTTTTTSTATTTLTTLQLQLQLQHATTTATTSATIQLQVQLQLHYNYTCNFGLQLPPHYTTTTPHYIQQLWVR